MSMSSSPSVLASLSPASKDIISGTCAGVMSILVCHPLDTVRVRLQTTSNSYFVGVVDVIGKTIRNEGVLALYKGMSTPLFAQGVQKATMFYAYGGTMRFINKRMEMKRGSTNTQQQTLLPLQYVALCGGAAGTANALVATPIELVRNRLQVQYHRVSGGGGTVPVQRRYTGPIDCIRQIIRQSGIKGLYLGLMPMIYRDLPGVAAWYTAFEGARRWLTAGEPGPPPKSKLMLAGACGGIGFWTVAFPFDAVKSIIQTRQADTQPPLTHIQSGHSSRFLSTARALVSEYGWRRLYRGFPIALFRGIPGAAITFTTYQTVMQWLNSQQAVPQALPHR